MVKVHLCILQKKIQENGLYLLDEPENSLSPKLDRADEIY